MYKTFCGENYFVYDFLYQIYFHFNDVTELRTILLSFWRVRFEGLELELETIFSGK